MGREKSSFTGYRDLVEVARSPSGTLYTATGEDNGLPLLLKSGETPAAIAAIRHEKRLLELLAGSPHFPRLIETVEEKGRTTIAMERLPLPTLAELLGAKKRFSTEEFLDFALAAVKALEELHKKDIIHRDISEGNILYDSKNKRAVLLDFSLSLTISHHRSVPRNPDLIEGTLAYIAPEQTGRMNRGTDYRADYYSLGVLFYRALTGDLPFLTKDPIELVYSHIALKPEAPSRIDPSIPETLSRIALKLLNKEPDERYQSSAGIRGDLERFRELLQGEELPLFPLGERDTYEKFRLPDKLYGRERELELLIDSYEEVIGGKSALLFISGYSGVGKTRLVNELYTPISDKEGEIISGKCDQYRRNVPYLSFCQAFAEYIESRLKEGEEKLAPFRKKLQKKLGDSGKILTDLIPTLELIIGKQKAVAELGVEETKNRFTYLFHRFVECLPTAERPLVIFLDDLQWGDPATFRMVEQLSLFTIPHLMIIIGYRDNEVEEWHPLKILQNTLEKEHLPFVELQLKPLREEDAGELVADALLRKREETLPLAELLYKKTAGNPFFTLQLLKKLHESDLITYEWESATWQWQQEKIAEVEVSDNVVDLMVGKIKELKPEAERLIMVASAIGNSFSIKLLQKLLEKSEAELRPILEELQQKEYLTAALGSEYYAAEKFRFAHDRIQQAAHALLSDEERVALHFTIADDLVKGGKESGDLPLFAIADHYNHALDEEKRGGVEGKKRREIALLNFEAAKKAKGSSAYDTALSYCKKTKSWLGEEDWESDYALLIALYTEAVEAAYLSGEEKLVEEYAALIEKRSKRAIDAIPALQVKGVLTLQQGDSERAAAIMLDGFKSFSISIPRNPGPARVLWNVLLTNIRLTLSGRTIEELADLPLSNDEEWQKLTSFAIDLGSSMVHARKPLIFAIEICKLVALIPTRGNTKESDSIFLAYGIPLISVNATNRALRFAELGALMTRKDGDKKAKAQFQYIYHYWAIHWNQPLFKTIPFFEEVYENNREAGSIKFAAQSHAFLALYALLSTTSDLRAVLREASKRQKNLRLMKCPEEAEWMENVLLWASFLSERPLYAGEKGSKIPEELRERKFEFPLSFIGYYSFYSMASIILREFSETLSATEKLAPAEREVPGSLFPVAYHFYRPLALIALYREASRGERLLYSAKIRYHLLSLRHFAKYGPNFVNKYHLALAEWARVRGYSQKAERHYALSIDKAIACKFLGETALALELAGRHHLERGLEEVAALYLEKAAAAYGRWGAMRKVFELSDEFGHLYEEEEGELPTDLEEAKKELLERKAPATLSFAKTLTASGASRSFDIESFQRSAESIASTIVIDELIKKLVDIVMEHAGADRCLVIVKREGGYLIEAEGNRRLGNRKLLETKPVDGEALPLSVFQIALNFKKEVLIKDAARDKRYRDDNYIKAQGIRSLLMMPLVSNHQVTALLYLENNLSRSAFTEERLAELRILSSQLAMSVENAKLYEGTVKLNAAYERFVPKDFLASLGKKSIVDVELGDSVEREMSVLFMDIRGFTSLSEKMTPRENFAFINEFLSRMEPVIRSHGGYIDKFIGDAIMALFPRSADDAVGCSLSMLEALKRYNEERVRRGDEVIKIGIGINSGLLILGTVGNDLRMDGTVISDVVNVASRVEHLTKELQSPLLITEESYNRLQKKARAPFRECGKIPIRGKEEPLLLFSVMSE